MAAELAAVLEQQMYYIMDSFGNYYRVGANQQLVAAGGADEAGVFSFFEANQRIGSGKKSKFYTTVPVFSAEKDAKTEYQMVSSMTECIDCGEMTGALDYCIGQMQQIEGAAAE